MTANGPDFGYNSEGEFSSDPKRREEEIRLTTFLSLYLAEEETNKAYEQLMACANKLDEIINQIIPLAAAKGFTYDGQFFESQTHMVRIENGLYFLQSLSNNVLMAAHEAQGKQGILSAIAVALKDLDEAIVQLGSLQMTGKFENPILKREP